MSRVRMGHVCAAVVGGIMAYAIYLSGADIDPAAVRAISAACVGASPAIHLLWAGPMKWADRRARAIAWALGSALGALIGAAGVIP
jgi:hypothetical protein